MAAVGCHGLSFSLQPVHRPFTGFAVKPNVCHGVKPVNDRRLERIKIRDIKTGQEVFFDITHSAFNTSLFITLSNGIGHNGEAVVGGKIKVLGIEDGIFSYNAFEHGGFEVIDHDLIARATLRIPAS